MKNRCSKCGKRKAFKHFTKNRNQKFGLSRQCKACRSLEYQRYVATPEGRAHVRKTMRNNWYRRLYGISLDYFEKLVKKQKGKCPICKKKRRLCADHNHKTGKFRGAICWGCNTIIGCLELNHGSLRRIEKYLRRG